MDAYLDGKLAASVDELLGGADIDEILGHSATILRIVPSLGSRIIHVLLPAFCVRDDVFYWYLIQ